MSIQEDSDDKNVVELYPELFHYTTAAGLEGIVTSGQLIATSVSFLNDAEERLAFLNRRLPGLLRSSIERAINERSKIPGGQGLIAELGGPAAVLDRFAAEMQSTIRSISLEHDHPYVTSFCAASSERIATHGLLSQWRGYGHDGGYAIVFDTAGLNELMKQESDRYCFQSAWMGDVEYHDAERQGDPAYADTRRLEREIDKAIHEFILSAQPGPLAAIASPITILSCRYKHVGFSEESEVRIVVLVPRGKMLEAARADGNNKPVKPIVYTPKQGLLVPRIRLFELGTKLPIKRVIIGPHPDKARRVEAVKNLLAAREIGAVVTASDIPYIGA